MVKMGTEPNYYSDDEDLFRGRNELVSKPTRRPKTCDPKKKTRSKIIVKCCCEQPEEYNYNSYTNHSGSSTKKIGKTDLIFHVYGYLKILIYLQRSFYYVAVLFNLLYFLDLQQNLQLLII